MNEPTEQEKEEMARAYRERAKEDLELCDAMNHGPEIRALKARVVALEAELQASNDQLRGACEAIKDLKVERDRLKRARIGAD